MAEKNMNWSASQSMPSFSYAAGKYSRKKMDELGFEPKTFRMRSEHSTPELHARCYSTDRILL